MDFSQEKDFPRNNLLLRDARTLEELLSEALFLREVAPADSAAALPWCSFLQKSSKIREKHALRKILFQRAAQSEAPFLINSAKNLLCSLLGEIHG
jgi:hypothetical protein